jgi:Phage Mu protein F like protein
MSSPPQPPPQYPPPPAGGGVVAAVAGILLTSATVDAAMAALAAGGAGLVGTGAAAFAGARQLAWRGALGIVMGHPPGADGFHGAAGRNVARVNLMRRAQFTVSAAQRLSQDISRGISTLQPIATALNAGLQRERRFYGQHLMAIWNRQKAGSQADSAAMTHGDLLGWHTVIDGRTSAECRQADGRNFYVGEMPKIGYPGMVHPHCRCWPGKPFRDGDLLDAY